MYLELVNRSRRDPAAEGVRLASLSEKSIVEAYAYFSVDLGVMRSALAAFAPAPPLAFESRLISAARGHSLWMKTAGSQMHNQVNTQTGAVLNSPDQRLTAAGYPWQRLGESIFAYAESPEHGHAGFVVDWGPGPAGMQDPPGHRISNFRPDFREVGIGVLNGPGANGTGPQIVTIDFAARRNPTPLLVGTVFYDLNGNGFYDLGEGIGGVTARIPDATAYAMTAGSGGYVVPTTDGPGKVDFSWQGSPLGSVSFTVSGGVNVPASLIVAYRAPVVIGPQSPALSQVNAYVVPVVPGATGFQWRTQVPGLSPSLNAESGLARMLLNAPGTPFPVVPRGNGKAYHLTHGSGQEDQVLEVDAWIRPKPGGKVRFSQQLGYAGVAQVAVLQVREDAGEWEEIWSKTGDNTSGAKTFTTESIDLARFVGKQLRFRFLYSLRTGSYFSQIDGATGIQFDDINFPESEEVLTGPTQTLAVGEPLLFVPDAAVPVELILRAVRTQGYWPWGPPLLVTPKVGPSPAPIVSGVHLEPDGTLRIDFKVMGAGTGIPTLLRSPGMAGSFVPVAGSLKTNGPGNFSFRYSPDGTAGFLRVSQP